MDNNFDKEVYIAFYDNGARLMKILDDKFLEFQEEDYDLIHIPSIIEGEILKKCGYFDTFPQHITPVCSLNNTETKYNYTKIKNRNIKISNYYLTPAACVHIYPMLEKQHKLNHCYTTYESVYRYENGEFKENGRIWEFTVREFVFVGSKIYVETKLKEFEKKAYEFAKKIGLKVECKAANDIFYPSKENIIKEKVQRANNSKKELVSVLNKKEIAIASFNKHNFHFSKPFNFDHNETVVTGCVGFGMERWLLCCQEQGIKICNYSEPPIRK